MKLKVGMRTATGLALRLDDGGDDVITIRCQDAQEDGEKIMLAVNSFAALVAALTPFRSNEMGGTLVDMIDQRETGGAQAEQSLRRMVAMIDMILDATEPAVEHEDAINA